MKRAVTTLSVMDVSLEKRLTILPRGFELKKSIGARATLWSMELWRVLLRCTKIPPMKKLVNPDITIATKDRTVKIILLSYCFYSARGSEVQEEIKKRRYPISIRGAIATSRAKILQQHPGD